jgi:DNA repair protein RAD16
VDHPCICRCQRCCAGTLNVVVYHGANRKDTFTTEQLESADVVLTSYSTLEVDYRLNVMPPKATCKYCGRKFQPERIKVHLRYFCGPFAQKTEAQAKQQKKRAPWMVGSSRREGSSGADDEKKKVLPSPL